MPRTSQNERDWKFSKDEGIYMTMHVATNITAYTFEGLMVKGTSETEFTTTQSYNAGTGETDIIFYIPSTATTLLATGNYSYQLTWYSSANYKPTKVWGNIQLTEGAFSE